MAECALLIALLLHRPPELIAFIWQPDIAGFEGVVVVIYESQFNEHALKVEAAGGTSAGLWQLWSECHEQYRDDLLIHIIAGADFWRECNYRARGITKRTMPDRVYMGSVLARAYSIFNSGSPWRSIEKGRAVQRKYDSLALYLWRRMR
jgi:hypothetical protein